MIPPGFCSANGASNWDLAIDPEVRVEIEQLFNQLRLAAKGSQEQSRLGQRKSLRIFPEFFRTRLEVDDSDENVYRLIADFIASLTESQTIDLHHRLTGIAFGQSLDRIV